MNDDVVYEFDFSKLTLQDYLTCVEIWKDPESRDSYLRFMKLIERTCVGFDQIPFSALHTVQDQFSKKFDLHITSMMSIDGFMNSLIQGDSSDAE